MRWRPIVGWEGMYEVSDRGDVRSVVRTIHTKRGPFVFQGKLLKPCRVEDGYFHVALSRPGKRQEVNIHTAVARAFIGKCPKGKEVCHKDGTRTNNHWRNLRYGTRKSNAEDRKTHGTDYGPPGLPGELNPNVKLTEEKVRYVLKSPDKTLKQLGKELGVHLGTIYHIRSRKTWAHVKV